MQLRQNTSSATALTKWLLLLATSIALLVATSSARAQSAVAQSLFDEGKRLMAAGQTADACDKFAASEQAFPSTGALLNLAVCHKKLGMLATAWAEFKRAVPRARKDGREDRQAFAEREAGALFSKLSYVTLEVASTTGSLPGAEATLDSTSLPSSSFGIALPADPGSHRVTVRAPGYEPWSKSFTITGNRQQMVLEVPELRALARHATLVVTAPADLSGMEIKIDGSPLSRAQLGKPQQLALGAHVVTASAPGHTSWERSVELNQTGVREEVNVPRLRMKEVSAASAGKDKGIAPASLDADLGESNSNIEAEDRQRRRRPSSTRWGLVSGFILTGVGVGAAATGIIFGQYARTQADKAQSDVTLCPDYKCSEYGYYEQIATAKRNATLANVLVPSGAALVLAGVGFFILGDHNTRADAPLIRPYFAAQGAGVDLGGTF